MSKFTLAFGIHNHQPVGNFEAVFEDAHQKAYLPFLRLVESFPEFRMSLHQSGILWKWQRETHPDYYELVGRLLDRGQIDLLTGGFYEPILSSIPERDVRGQIGMLTSYLQKHFGFRCEGLWLTERIWEPHLPKILAESGVKFLPVDDTHFIYAGFEHAQLTGPFVTENEGHTVTLLPIQKRLRYLIPFGKVDDVIAELKSQVERDPNGVAVYADDGEKFGVWPETHRHCYEDKWLPQLLEAIQRNSDWLQVAPLSAAAKRTPVGRAYLPTASYEEMLHWALPTGAFVAYEEFEHWLKAHGRWEMSGRFVRGGHWRGFLTKYEEANLLHKKMLWVSNQVASVETQNAAKSAEVEKARDQLYASQCNCPYWHGVFGGLYLPHIRQAVYSAMIEASHICASLDKNFSAVTEADYDADGQTEVILRNRELTAILKPGRGGALLSLSLDRLAFELTDTLSRRREGYHNKLEQATAPGGGSGSASIHDQVLTKEAGLSRFLIEDWYLKRCLIDHFIAPDTTLESFAAGTNAELGDFILEQYSSQVAPSGVALTRDGHVRIHDRQIPVRVSKSIALTKNTGELTVVYDLRTINGEEIDVCFAVENNFSFQAGHAEDRYLLIDGVRPKQSFLDSTGSTSRAKSIAMIDDWRKLGVVVSSDATAEIWHLPIFTVSLSEGGFERVYQGTTLVHKLTLRLSSRPSIVRLSISACTADTIKAVVGAVAGAIQTQRA
jgi:alpha-amylase